MDGLGFLDNNQSRRILIVEDDPVSALLLRRVLENRGYSVDHAENGMLALDCFKDGEHRVIITDWMMPEMDGVSLCREVRQLSKAYTYVLLLSAKGQRQDRLEAFEAGVDDFLSKPLDREELFARIKVTERIVAQEDMPASRRMRSPSPASGCRWRTRTCFSLPAGSKNSSPVCPSPASRSTPRA